MLCFYFVLCFTNVTKHKYEFSKTRVFLSSVERPWQNIQKNRVFFLVLNYVQVTVIK